MLIIIQAIKQMYACIHTQTHTHWILGALGQGGKRLNTHDLFCSLSRCLPFFLHPPCGGGVGGDDVGAGTDCVFVLCA